MTELKDADLPPPYIVHPVYGPLYSPSQLRQAIKDYLAKHEVRTTQKQFESEVRSLIVKE